MVRESLYFGLSRPSGEPVTDAQWQAFVAEVVTSALPNGFTVLDGMGQYREESGRIVREPSKLVIILHSGAQAGEAAVAAILDAYRKRFDQESVLRERGAVCARF